MKNRYVIGIAGFVFILVLTFNACQPLGLTGTTGIGNLNSRNTSIAGNPMIPVSEKVIGSVCRLITRCNTQLNFEKCENDLWDTVGIASKLGISTLSGQPFSSFIQMESQGEIYGNITALTTCNQNLEALACNDPLVQSAYDPNQAQAYTGVPNLFSTNGGSCPNVATKIDVLPWIWSAPWGSTGLNFSLPQNAYDPNLRAFSGKLYATWIENNAGYNVHVSVSNGTSPWQFVDGGTSAGLNYLPSLSAQTPFLMEFNAKLYAIWIENNGASDLVRLKVYNGNDLAPSWISIDGGGINKSLTANAANPELVVFNSKLYATWVERNNNTSQIRVAVYSGNDALPIWSFVDRNSSGGINFDNNHEANSPRFQVFNSSLYATWTEVSGSGIKQIRVAHYNGNDASPSWNFVDGNSNNGLNYESVQNAQNPQLAVSQSKLYLTWQEWNSPTSEQIRVAVFNGNDSLPSWSFVDGGKSYGINWNPAGDGQLPQLLGTATNLFITWREQIQGQGIIHARSFNGNDSLPVWPSIDGNLSTGLNMNPNNDAGFSFKRNPMLIELNSHLYLIWNESNRIQIKEGSQN
ncbi:MAG: hypothetical protein ACXVB4_18610 [Pseudobdellovibrionaceae bacterium]